MQLWVLNKLNKSEVLKSGDQEEKIVSHLEPHTHNLKLVQWGESLPLGNV